MIKTDTRYRFKKRWFWGVVFLAFIMLACSSPFALFRNLFRGKNNETESWQAAVDEIRELTRGQSLPTNFGDPDMPVLVGGFDPNRLLESLKHLELQEGMVLDFVYWYDGLGGGPVLYAREEGANPFESYKEYQAAITEEKPGKKYLEYLEGDGSEEAYFQWVLMEMMGNQFYLYWHAGYNDDEIVASSERLEDIVDEMSDTTFGYPLSTSQKQQALKLEPAPVVENKEDHVTVRVLWFTKWGGFYETIYTLTRSAPYEIIDTQTEQLVPYECGVMF